MPPLAAAERHAEAALPHVVGGDYTVDHRPAAYATLLPSEAQGVVMADPVGGAIG